MQAERPARALQRVVPPDGRRSRELTVLHPALSGRYTSLVASVAARVEASMSTAVAANRVVSASVDPPKLVLRPWRVERAAFGRRLARLAARAPCLLFADVRDCYASIRWQVVDAALLELGCDPVSSRAVAAFVRRLSAHGVVGLPVGPEPSAVLANAVLSGLDRALARSSVAHLRWVDDVVTVLGGPDDAAAMLDVLGEALRDLGLELNETKTRVVVDPAAIASTNRVSVARATPDVG